MAETAKVEATPAESCYAAEVRRLMAKADAEDAERATALLEAGAACGDAEGIDEALSCLERELRDRGEKL